VALRDCEPAVVEAYLDGSLALAFSRPTRKNRTASPDGLGDEEAAILAFLLQRLRS